MSVRGLKSRIEKLQRRLGTDGPAASEAEIQIHLFFSAAPGCSCKEVDRVLQAHHWGHEPPKVREFTNGLFALCGWIVERTARRHVPKDAIRWLAFEAGFVEASRA